MLAVVLKLLLYVGENENAATDNFSPTAFVGVDGEEAKKMLRRWGGYQEKLMGFWYLCGVQSYCGRIDQVKVGGTTGQRATQIYVTAP